MTSAGVCQVGIGPELRCYQCNSLTQPHCADYFDNRTFPLVACPNDGRNYSRCVKMIQEMYLDGKWTRRYYRDCAVTGVIGAEDGRWCIDRLGTYRVKVRYCNCNNKNGYGDFSLYQNKHLTNNMLKVSILFITIILTLLLENIHGKGCRAIGEKCSKTVFDRCCGDTVCHLTSPFHGKCVKCLKGGTLCISDKNCCSHKCTLGKCTNEKHHY
ncbi:unnamed protein product [Schistosoma curassoni]|nr:unnamed protein product [Schistosoma curassoni]